jgi:hypothetical protein
MASAMWLTLALPLACLLQYRDMAVAAGRKLLLSIVIVII